MNAIFNGILMVLMLRTNVRTNLYQWQYVVKENFLTYCHRYFFFFFGEQTTHGLWYACL